MRKLYKVCHFWDTPENLTEDDVRGFCMQCPNVGRCILEMVSDQEAGTIIGLTSVYQTLSLTATTLERYVVEVCDGKKEAAVDDAKAHAIMKGLSEQGTTRGILLQLAKNILLSELGFGMMHLQPQAAPLPPDVPEEVKKLYA